MSSFFLVEQFQPTKKFLPGSWFLVSGSLNQNGLSFLAVLSDTMIKNYSP